MDQPLEYYIAHGSEPTSPRCPHLSRGTDARCRPSNPTCDNHIFCLYCFRQLWPLTEDMFHIWPHEAVTAS